MRERLHVVDRDRVAVVRLGVVRGVVARATPRSRRAARSWCRTRACAGGRPSRTSRSASARTACRTAPGPGRRTRGSRPRRRAFRSARVVEPYTSTTTSTWPARIAAVACSTMNSHVEPPTPVPSTQVGRRPRYSPISIGASRPVPLDAEAVDVVLGEAGVGDRARRGLVVQLVRRLRVDPPDVGERRADDRDSLRPSRHRSFHSTRLPDAKSCWPSAIESWLVPIATYA